MKNLKLIWALSALFWCGSLFAGNVTWTSSGPGAGSNISAIAVQADNPDIVYIGGRTQGVWKSTDGGNVWEPKNNGLVFPEASAKNYAIQDIVVDPNNGSNVWICTEQGIFKSTDGGNVWGFAFEEPYSFETPAISTLAIDPLNGNNLWAGVGNTQDNTGGDAAIFSSTNGGQSWTKVTTGMPADAVVHSIIIDPTSPGANRSIYVSTSKGLWRSTDGGNNWSSSNSGLPHNDLRKLEAVEEPGGNVVMYMTLASQGDPTTPASFKGGVYKSTDGGNSWAPAHGNLPTVNADNSSFYKFNDIAVDFEEPSIIYVGTTTGVEEPFEEPFEEPGEGIWRSTDGGSSWNKVDGNTTYGWMDDTWWNNHNVSAIAIAPSNTSVVYIGNDFLRKSTDGGNIWTQIYTENSGNLWRGRGLQNLQVFDVAFHPTDANTMFVGFDNMGLWKSTDGGNFWERLDDTPGMVEEPGTNYDNANSIALDPTDGGNIWVGRNGGLDEDFSNGFTGGNVFKSTDGGNVWSKVSGIPEGRPVVAVDPNSPANARELFAISYGNGVYKSSDGGNTWAPSNTGLGTDGGNVWDIALNFEEPGEAYLAMNALDGSGSIYKSTDGGNIWSRLSNAPAGDVLDIAVDVEEPGVVYAAVTSSFNSSYSGGLYKSTDGGNSWALILEEPRINNIAIMPGTGNNNTVVASSQQWTTPLPGQNAGVWKTTDGGNVWEPITGDLGHIYVQSVAFNPHDPNQLWVGTHGGGLYNSNNAISVGISEDPYYNEGVKVFPNPFKDVATITVDDASFSSFAFTLYDQLGRTVKTVYTNNGRVNISSNNLSNGIYHYSVNSDEKVISTGKLVVH